MSVTNGDRTVTKQDLADFYREIQPYLGCMPEMVANKFSKGDLYSTDEKMIGQWIDGKPLYQKCIEFTSISVSGNTWASVSNVLSGLNVDVVTNIILRQDNHKSFYPATDGSDGNNLTFMHFRNAAVDFDGATIQYTKTTDTAISIGSDTDYSTEEKIVGTWIDSKPIWQKTIAFDTNTYTDQQGRRLFSLGSISNVDMVISVNGTFSTNNGASYICGAPLNAPSNQTYVNTNYTVYGGLVTATHQLNLNLHSQVQEGKTQAKGYVTVQYTKTT